MMLPDRAAASPGPAIVLVVGKRRAELDRLLDRLLAAGFDTRTAETAAAAWKCIVQDSPFAILLDAPDDRAEEAWSLCRELTQTNEQVVVLLTPADSSGSASAPITQALAVSYGADFHVAIVDGYEQIVAGYLQRQSARYQRLVQSTSEAGRRGAPSRLVFDSASQRVYRNGRAIHLTKREFALLQVLARQPDRAVSLDELCAALWECKQLVAAVPLLKQYIARLRHKLEPDPARPVHFETVRGVGYCFHVTGAVPQSEWNGLVG